MPKPPDIEIQATDDYQEKESFLPTVVKPFVGMLLKDQFLSSEDCQPFQKYLLYMQEGQSLDLQNPYKCQVGGEVCL